MLLTEVPYFRVLLHLYFIRGEKTHKIIIVKQNVNMVLQWFGIWLQSGYSKQRCVL